MVGTLSPAATTRPCGFGSCRNKAPDDDQRHALANDLHVVALMRRLQEYVQAAG
jgi:hypothetical protein